MRYASFDTDIGDFIESLQGNRRGLMGRSGDIFSVRSVLCQSSLFANCCCRISLLCSPSNQDQENFNDDGRTRRQTMCQTRTLLQLQKAILIAKIATLRTMETSDETCACSGTLGLQIHCLGQCKNNGDPAEEHIGRSHLASVGHIREDSFPFVFYSSPQFGRWSSSAFF